MKLKCICNNPQCNQKGIKTEIEWDGVSSYSLSLLVACPSCKERREVLDNKQENENKLLTISTPYIDSLSPQERKKLLKERSNRDFHKNIEEKKKVMDRNILPKH